jgi:hypothetical protein
MNLNQFRQSLLHPTPPPGISLHLLSLWHEGRQNWEEAHRLVQDETDAPAAGIHAYLHRREGDNFNAGYWYRKAGKPMPVVSLQQEWDALVTDLLAQNT